MRILLKVSGIPGDFLPRGEISLQREEISLRGFLEFVDELCGGKLGNHLFPGGSWNPHYAVLVNGIHIQNVKGMATPLKDGDRVSVFTLVAGG